MNIEKTMKLVLRAWATAHSFEVDNLSVSFSFNGLLWHVTIDDVPDGDVSFPLIGGQLVTGDTIESALSELARRVWTALTPKWECLDELREEILAPGELTPDERVTAERERCAAVADRVASESDATANALADKRIFNAAKARLRGEATIVREIAAKIRKGA